MRGGHPRLYCAVAWRGRGLPCAIPCPRVQTGRISPIEEEIPDALRVAQERTLKKMKAAANLAGFGKKTSPTKLSPQKVCPHPTRVLGAERGIQPRAGAGGTGSPVRPVRRRCVVDGTRVVHEGRSDIPQDGAATLPGECQSLSKEIFFERILVPGGGGYTGGGFVCHKFCARFVCHKFFAKFVYAIRVIFLRIGTGIR